MACPHPASVSANFRPRLGLRLRPSPKGCMVLNESAWGYPLRRGLRHRSAAEGVSGGRRCPEDGHLAEDTLQHFLDRMGQAVMQERFDDYAEGVHLPFFILTSAVSLTVTTIEDLRDGFDDFVEMIQSRGVTDMIRTVIAARAESPGRIVGIYRTRLEGDAGLVLPEFYSRMWLERVDGVWKATKIHNTTADTRWPMLMSRVAPLSEPPEDLLK